MRALDAALVAFATGVNHADAVATTIARAITHQRRRNALR